MDLLPDELLADILGRLPPCDLAASRCVRKHWCAVIDARRLLRADLLPLRLEGFFCRHRRQADPYGNEPENIRVETYRSVFFARPSTGRRISGNLDLLWDDDHDIYNPWISDHCNGLVLLFNGLVVNPATGQSVRLPPFPRLGFGDYYGHRLLAYDPMASLSPHFEVVLVLDFPFGEHVKKDSEWPPSPFTMHVFSPRKWTWEERSFVREGEVAAGTIAEMNSTFDCWKTQHAVHLRGAIYVPYPNYSVMRITLWNDRYRIIKPPAQNQVLKQGFAYLGKSQKGVYFVLLTYQWSRFRVWFLNESCTDMEWVLRSDISLQAMVENSPIYDHADTYNTPWIVNYEKDVSEAWTEDESEWDFESGIVLHEANDKVTRQYEEIYFLGFHPFKEIVFFLVSFWRVVSYDLNSTKIQELGILGKDVVGSFPYTPCWMGDLYNP